MLASTPPRVKNSTQTLQELAAALGVRVPPPLVVQSGPPHDPLFEGNITWDVDAVGNISKDSKTFVIRGNVSVTATSGTKNGLKRELSRLVLEKIDQIKEAAEPVDLKEYCPDLHFSTLDEITNVAKDAQRPLSFDLEWDKAGTLLFVSVAIRGSDNKIWVNCSGFRSEKRIPPIVHQLLARDAVYYFGKTDIQKLGKHKISLGKGAVDIQCAWERYNPNISLRSLVGCLLGYSLSKNDEMRFSFNTMDLSEEQIKYAVLDAAATLEVCERYQQMECGGPRGAWKTPLHF